MARPQPRFWLDYDEQTYTKDELLAGLRAFRQGEGRNPTSSDLKSSSLRQKYGLATVGRYYSRFDGFSKALGEAGLVPQVDAHRKAKRVIDASNVGEVRVHLKALIGAYVQKHGRPPTSTEYNRLKDRVVSQSTIQKVFGGYRAMLLFFGFSSRSRGGWGKES